MVNDGDIAAGEVGVAAVSGEVVFVGVVLVVIGVDAVGIKSRHVFCLYVVFVLSLFCTKMGASFA